MQLRTSRNTPIETTVAVTERSASEVPETFALGSNYPNPFRSATKFRYDLPESADVTLAVYDMLGRRVRTLLSETKEAGIHTVTLQSRGLSSGVYVMVMKAGDFRATQKVTLVR